jgi:hypothetical protein
MSVMRRKSDAFKFVDRCTIEARVIYWSCESLEARDEPESILSTLLGSTETTVLGCNVRIDGTLEFTERYADIAPYDYNVLGQRQSIDQAIL